MKRPTRPNRPGSSKSALGRTIGGRIRRLTEMTLLAMIGLAGLPGCGEDRDDDAGTCGALTAAEGGTEIFIEDFVDGEPGTWRVVEVEGRASDGAAATVVGEATLSSRANLQNPDVHMQVSCADQGNLAPDDVLTVSVGVGMDVDRKTGQESARLTLKWRQFGDGTPELSHSVAPTSEVLTPMTSNADESSISRLPDGRVEIFFTRTDPNSGRMIAARVVYTLVE